MRQKSGTGESCRGLADAMGTRAMLIAGPIGAAVAYIWMALGHDTSLLIGVIGPMALLGTASISVRMIVQPLSGKHRPG